MKLIVTLLTVIVIVTSCNKNTISGYGSTKTETRTVSPFTGVQIEGSSSVTISQGAQQKLEVSGYENLLPIYETYVQNGTLVLKFKSDYYNVRNNNIRVSITAGDISKLGINGSGVFTIKNFNSNSLTALINGSGNINIENSIYNSASLKVNGSGEIRGQQLLAKQADVEINGSGTIDIHCTEKLNAAIHGSGEINYWGNPANVTVDVSGSGKVRKR